MTGALRHRVLTVILLIAVSMPLMGCLASWLAYEEGENEAAAVAEEKREREAREAESQSDPPQETAPSDQEGGTLTGEQESPATGPISPQELAGTYSGSAALQHIEEGVESAKSLPVTLQLNEAGTGTVNVNGYSGEAQSADSAVSFSVTMEEGGTAVLGQFKGAASRSGGQIVISGNMDFSMMGITFASYSWTAQK